jgi:hypothetical protein
MAALCGVPRTRAKYIPLNNSKLADSRHRALSHIIVDLERTGANASGQSFELFHELSSDNVRENLAAATFWKGCSWDKRTEVKNPRILDVFSSIADTSQGASKNH